jgi:hypothetical protein
MLENLHKANHDKVDEMLNTIQEAAINNENLFDHLMEATKVCSLGQITSSALFEVGGQYRRNKAENHFCSAKKVCDILMSIVLSKPSHSRRVLLISIEMSLAKVCEDT